MGVKLLCADETHYTERLEAEPGMSQWATGSCFSSLHYFNKLLPKERQENYFVVCSAVLTLFLSHRCIYLPL